MLYMNDRFYSGNEQTLPDVTWGKRGLKSYVSAQDDRSSGHIYSVMQWDKMGPSGIVEGI